MRYYIPDIRLPAEAAKPKPGLLTFLFGRRPPTALEKLGGCPDGLPADLWPKCAQCGRSQTFLGQFAHAAGRLDLKGAGRVLYVFKCAWEDAACDTWTSSDGANRALVVEARTLTGQSTPAPADDPPRDHEVIIVGWQAREDRVPTTLAPAFYDEDSWLDLDDALTASVSMSTKLGSVPNWIQSPNEAPQPDWRFIGQLDGQLAFIVAPQTKVPWVTVSDRIHDGFAALGDGANFGDGGTAYIFLRDSAGLPEASLIVQGH